MVIRLFRAVVRGSAAAWEVVLIAAACAAIVGPAFSQQKGGDAPRKDSPQSLIEAAHAKSETASSAADYGEIIRLCEQARGSKLSPASVDYANQLLSWALNRRGEAYAEQAAALAKKGRKEDAAKTDSAALADFEAAVKADPKRWRALHNRGVSLALAGRCDEAMRDFNRVIELKPDYANAWFNRGEIRYDQGQHEEAAADYSQALRLNDKDAGAYACRGHAYFQLRQFQQALADYDQAVRLDGKSAEALANRADAYQSLGQWEQAAVDYRGSVELDQRLGRAYLGAAWLMATCPRDEIRNADLAIEAAKKAIELEGEQKHQHLDTLAAAYANAGLFDQAKATLEKAIRLAPEADAKRMRERLALYDAGKPYRQDDRSTVRSAVRSSSAGASP